MNLSELNEDLQHYFHGRLRARQSIGYEDRFYIEEQTARATSTVVADLRSFNRVQRRQRIDAIERAKDGYTQVMEVRHGAAFGCVACGARNACPVNATREVKCTDCTHQHYVAHYLDKEHLITHLRMIDPLNSDLRDRVKRDDQKKAFKDKDEMRMLNSEGAEAFRDTLIEQIPAARLSGRTQAWITE